MMVCNTCGSTRIEWKGPLSNLTHTECPDCGGKNCHKVEAPTCPNGVDWCDGDRHTCGECQADETDRVYEEVRDQQCDDS